MSQIALTGRERTEALVRLGYTAREAEFLCLAALHGGYFLRRQYCRFIGKEVGGTAAALIEKVLAKCHGTAATGCRNAKVYHLGSRPFFAALGQEDNRNRRARPTVVIKNKLMGLDLILDNPRREYLSTEQEKLAYFMRTLGVDRAELPVKEFRSPTAVDRTARYFVDKYPIAIADEVSPVAFAFMDEGLATPSRFGSYLRQYGRLFARLERFELVYASASEAPFSPAEGIFHSFVSRRGSGHPLGRRPCDVERLLTHFEDRRQYDAGRRETFDRAGLIRLRDDRRQFSGTAFDLLYRTWQADGDEPIREAFVSQEPSSGPAQARFRTHLLMHNYEVFGNVSKPNNAS